MQAQQSQSLTEIYGFIFSSNSTSRLLRNGVGIDKDGQLIFAITDSKSPKFPQKPHSIDG